MESGREGICAPAAKGCGSSGVRVRVYMYVCTYAEFLQTDSNPFHALQFFAVSCLDALFCLPLIPESVQPVMLAVFRGWEYMIHGSGLGFNADAALVLTYICAGEGKCNPAGCVM